MVRLIEIASTVSTPLALAGLFGVALLIIFKQIIINKPSNRIVNSIINKLFILSFVAMFLGFFSNIIAQIIPQKANHPISEKPRPNIERLNILVFDASYTDHYIHVAYKLRQISNTATIDMQNNWKNKHIMEVTRIVFLKKDHILIAKNIGEWLDINPIFVDYTDQTPEQYRKVVSNESLFDKNTFIGFDKTRDIVIFLGRDYEYANNYHFNR